ncbi:alpha-1,6-mannosylglycoprotein 6-beta-N-acetylglucosaminyltransferase B [Notothenia coriiceps]|uniref:alpha-1,6-mannosyl-glycoprotein 6-beta-N-acetylglucosaminyltransferase n=1 Tax=Notothenia coriiceps TaxID=8208 RepID=A0A6I9P3G9_9TELE|nr:PREDICTED: alpha-1,6-mannosylglycoprotein 6-beta-N-acetylglucosaminyltransferase B [Notothenia coriiceps]
MIASSSDLSIMVRRCLLTFKPFRIFVVGIGFFSLCFLMTSLGGQLSAKRPGDSPFTVRSEVLGGQESRGVLRKISDMLEVIMKRMDALSKVGNSTDAHRLDELSSALDRIQPVGLVERIQAIAQNMSDMAGRVEQILQRSMAGNKVRDGTLAQCGTPKDPRYPDCLSKMDWMHARWTSDPCYAFYGVDGSDCSFLVYLSEVEWFCPPLIWRNQTATPTLKPLPKKQAVFQSDIGALLEQVGTGKESLSFMKRRMRRMAAQWASAARRLDDRLRSHWREQNRTLNQSMRFLGVPPGRGSCPLTGPLPFDLIYTDYHGLQQMKQHMGLSLRKHKCHIRVIDTFGTEPAYNHEEYAILHGYRTNWGYWNLHGQQYMTMFPHTPDNSFMGFVAEELNETEKQNIQRNKVNNMAVVYGKEASMWKGKEKFLTILHRYMEIHGTVYYETQRPPEVPAFVKNHGLLPQQELQQLLRKAKLFIGLGFPYEGPAPLEAIANGCIFLQPKFNPPHSSLNHDFFRGKPTSRKVSSQHPYAEQYIGRPHVITIDFNNSEEFEATIREIMRINVEPLLPYEYTCEGMLERVHAYIQNQDFCSPEAPFPPVNSSWLSSPFVLLPNSSILTWASNASSYTSWPPLSALRLLASLEGESCVEACQGAELICEPALYRFINIKEAFSALELQCDGVESQVNHLLPAFSAEHAECGLQQDPLLFSCAGSSAKYQRLCPCRDYRVGQVALCRDCL